MGRVTGSWDRPIQGVSQQVDKDRKSGQCSVQENFISSPLNGLIKRIGTRHLGKILESVSPQAKFYAYNRGVSEAYLIVVEPSTVLPREAGVIRVFDLEGVERTVEYSGDVADYHEATDPSSSLSLSTIGDFTFLTNKDVVVATLPDLTPINPPITIIYCQYATYSRDYRVLINGDVVAQYTTPNSGDVANEPSIKTNKVIDSLASQLVVPVTVESHSVDYSGIAEQVIRTNYYVDSIFSIKYAGTETLITDYTIRSHRFIRFEFDIGIGTQVEVRYKAKGAGATGYYVEKEGNVLYLSRADETTFEVSTIDSADGNDLVAIQDSVRAVENLPPKAPDGYVVKVQNQSGFDANAYWLKAVPSDGIDQTGSKIRWVETTEQASLYKFDKSTMPHVLVSEADGTFTFRQGDWEDREVGNERSNPFPSFVGNRISTLGSFQNRIVATAEEAAIFGRTNEFFNFFRETTQVESASDPIDIFADDNQINKLLHHEVLDGDIVFFSQNGQFLINGSKPITKGDTIFKKATAYPMNTKAAPAATGESVVYSFVAGEFAGLREMFTDSLTDTKRARPITDHVSDYIEGVPNQIAASPNINTIFINTDASKEVLYVYEWLWVGQEKAQSAFHKWVFTGEVLFTQFIEDKLYLVIQRDTGVYLEQIPLSNDTNDSGLPFAVRLDQRAVVTATWSGERWEWTIPYEILDETTLEFVLGDGCHLEDRGVGVDFIKDGAVYYTYDDIASVEPTVELVGGVEVTSPATCKLTVGTKFNAKYVPTQPFIKDQKERILGLDRFTLGKVHLNYESVGTITVKVRDKLTNRSWSYDHNGRVLGASNNQVGFANLRAGTFSFPVRLESERAEMTIETDSYVPFTLRDMEWGGMFKQRGKRF